ncbi:hypothetical protein [Mycolicibacter kumamotonensis]|uniref:Uncharacterized protein n=1 Tax=Mycolicibacter kumamotonensis TaxID=354243 RepID=A0A1B8SL53_9MYCO|nr:hypothetical protein [Mycolicibacter kumamotonensis]OBY33482.1 hypothetical protein ACT18_00605 [Mycolicibacter kumamotonensis]
MGTPPPIGHEVAELYDSEKKALRGIVAALMQRHSFRGVLTVDQEDAVKRTFAEEARERCAEIGLVVDVLWTWEDENNPDNFSPNVSDDPDDKNLYWNPKVVVVARTDKLPEYDHERQKHEITSGLLNGDGGFIREDGSKRDDPIKKLII